MLHAAGFVPPQGIFAHGWWQVGQEKMSKSLGNVVDPMDVINEFGIDVYRYFLLRDVPFGLDGVFSREAIIKRFNGDLANDLGNLVYRTLTMSEKYIDGRIPVFQREARAERSSLGSSIVEKMDGLESAVDAALERIDFIAALEAIWGLIGAANKYVEETKPWNLKKEGRADALDDFLAVMFEVLRRVAASLSPFMPQTAVKISSQIQGDRVAKGEPLFPRIVVEKDKKQVSDE
jgi:methionyl-tRNA synthetase